MANNTRDEIIRYIFDAVGGEKVDSIGDSLKKVGEESQQTGTLFGFLEEHLGKIVTIAAAAEVALKGIEFGKESLKGVEDVEASLSRVKALASNAADQFGKLDDAVEKAALAVNVTSQQSATGLAALVNQGLDAKTAIEALIPTLQLAKIANIDVGTAAAEVAEALKAFNLPASDAQRVVDELTASSHGAAGGLAAMSSAAVQLAPDAKTLGLQFTDIVSILGLLNSKGIDTEKSVRGLRTVFQELQNPTSSLRGELLALGDGTNDFGAAIAALTSGTPRANEALLTLNGPARSLVETLGQAGPEAIAKFNAQLQETQGTASKTASLIDDNLRGAATRFGNAIDLIGEKLVKPVLEPFKNELNKLADQLNEFADSPDFKEIQDAVGDMATHAAKALDDFIQGVNWKKLGDDSKATIRGLADEFDHLADSAGKAVTVINKGADFVGVAYHGAAATISAAVGVAATGIEDLTGATETLGDVARYAAEQASGQFEQFAADAIDLAGAETKAADATTKHGDAAASATPKVKDFSDVVAGVKTHAEETAPAVQNLAGTWTAQSEALDVARGAQLAAFEAMDKLAKAGDSNSDAFRKANAEYETATKEISDLTVQLGKGAASTGQFTAEMAKLGVTSQQKLKEAADAAEVLLTKLQAASDGSAAAIADIQNTFLAYAKARLAANAQLDEGSRATAEADLESKAAVLGVTSALVDLERQSDSSHAALVTDANRGADALDKEYNAADRLAGRLHSGGGAGDGSVSGAILATGEAVAEAQRQFTEWGVESGKTAEQLGANTSHANDGMAALAQGIANARTQYLAISDAAAKFYDLALKGNFAIGHSDDGSGFDRVARAMQAALKATDDEIAANRAQLQGMVDDANSVGTESVQDFNKLGGAAHFTEQQLEGTIAAIQAGNVQVGILGQQDLAPLQAALEAAKQRVDALKAASEQANQEIGDLNGQLQDQLDQQDNNQVAIENRSYEKQKQQIEDLAAQADASGKAQAAQALQRLDQLHQAKLKAIADEAAAQQKANVQEPGASSGGAAGNGSVGSNVSGGGKIDATTTVSRAGATSLGTLNLNHSITVNVPAGAGLKGLSDADIGAIAEQIVSTMGPELTAIVMRQLRYGQANSI